MSRRAALYERIRQERILAVVRSPDRAKPLVEGLWSGGIGLVEIALSSPTALDAIREVSPAGVVGAGTVRSRQDAEGALEAGASFLVSPGTDPDLIAWAAEEDVPHFPGVLTPTDIEVARQSGAGPLKLFPASVGGPAYVAALLAPFPDAELIPTGGVSSDNAVDYLANGAVAVALGGSLTRGQDQEAIRRSAATVKEAIDAARRQHVIG